MLFYDPLTLQGVATEFRRGPIGARQLREFKGQWVFSASGFLNTSLTGSKHTEI